MKLNIRIRGDSTKWPHRLVKKQPEQKNLLQSELELADEKISELKDKHEEIAQNREQKTKKEKTQNYIKKYRVEQEDVNV